MTHEELKELEYSDSKAAIDCVRAAAIGFMLEVMNDEGYSVRLQFEAAAAAAPIFHGPPRKLSKEEHEQIAAELSRNITKYLQPRKSPRTKSFQAG
jgi:hypothetical protein